MEVSVDQVGLDLEVVLEEEEPIRIPPRRNYAWLSKLTTIHLNLCGSDISQRIELSSPNGETFKTEVCRKKDENGEVEFPDQKQFSILNSKNEKLLTVDFSKDRKSFHIMEPDSTAFIAFFTLINPRGNSTVRIHNVIDEEMYVADLAASSPYHVQIKSEKGEEMGMISRPPPKWTKILAGTLVLNFTGDERDGLTTREKAILLGFLIALGILGMDYWKASTTGIFTVYILSILLLTALVIWIYLRLHQGNIHAANKTNNPSNVDFFSEIHKTNVKIG